AEHEAAAVAVQVEAAGLAFRRQHAQAQVAAPRRDRDVAGLRQEHGRRQPAAALAPRCPGLLDRREVDGRKRRQLLCEPLVERPHLRERVGDLARFGALGRHGRDLANSVRRPQSRGGGWPVARSGGVASDAPRTKSSFDRRRQRRHHSSVVAPAAPRSESPEAVAAIRRRILEETLARVDELVERSVALTLEQIPAYARAAQRDPELPDSVRDQVRRNYRANLLALLEGHRPTLDDTAFVRTAAAARARLGIELEDYLAAYR